MSIPPVGICTHPSKRRCFRSQRTEAVCFLYVSHPHVSHITEAHTQIQRAGRTTDGSTCSNTPPYSRKAGAPGQGSSAGPAAVAPRTVRAAGGTPVCPWRGSPVPAGFLRPWGGGVPSGVWNSRERDRFTVRPATHSRTVPRPPFPLHSGCRGRRVALQTASPAPGPTRTQAGGQRPSSPDTAFFLWC